MTEGGRGTGGDIIRRTSPLLLKTLGAAASALLLAAALPLTALAAVGSQGVPGESNLGFLLAGTALAWAGFFAYAFYVGRKNSELRRDIEELRRTLAERDK